MRCKGQMIASRNQKGVISPVKCQAVTASIRDNQERGAFRKIFGFIKQVNSRLQPGSTPATDSDSFRNVLRRHNALVIGSGITENNTDMVDIPGFSVACDCAKAGSKQASIHGTRGIQKNAKDALFGLPFRECPCRAWNIRRRALAAADTGVGTLRL